MDINKYIENEKGKLDFKSYAVVPAITCADGFTVSVQASRGHYCSPRDDFGPYSSFELGFPSEPDHLIMEYAENPSEPTGTIYGWVPVDVVEQLIENHGGVL